MKTIKEREENARRSIARAHPSLKNAKDGAPSSSDVGAVRNEHSTEKRKARWRRQRRDLADMGRSMLRPYGGRLGTDAELGEEEGVVEGDFAEVIVAAAGSAVACAHVGLEE